MSGIQESSTASFFDDNYENPEEVFPFRLWIKNKTIDEEEEVLWQAYMFRDKLDLELRHFKMTQKWLYCLSNSKNGKVSGAIDLSFVKCQFFEEKQQGKGKTLYEVKLFRNRKFFIMYTDDLETLKAFKKASFRILIQSDFHDRFKAEKLLGKGSYAKVLVFNGKHRGLNLF